MTTPILTLPPRWAVPEEVEVAIAEVTLGDNYDLIMPIGLQSLTERWNIESSALNPLEAQQLKDVFQQLAGAGRFEWSPTGELPRRTYYCVEWSISKIGPGWYRLRAAFENPQG